MKEKSVPNIYISSIPVCLAIAVATLFSIQVHIHLQNSIITYFLWVSLQAIGAIFVGFSSDLFCRRRIFLLTQLCGVITLLLIIFTKQKMIFFPLLGFLFHPYSVGLAGMIDNFPNSSKVKIAAVCFIAFLIPWLFYEFILEYGKQLDFFILVLLIVNFTLSFLFFYDKRDEKVRHSLFQFPREIHKNAKNKFLYTYIAFCFTQFSYFFINSYIETTHYSKEFYIILALGSIIGCIFTFFYKKLPHVSILTITYGIAFFMSFIPFLFTHLFGLEINTTFLFVVVGCLGGFFIPFVYDILINAVTPKVRGTSCGLVEFNYSIPHFISALFLKFAILKISVLLLSIPLCYFLATFIQKRSE